MNFIKSLKGKIIVSSQAMPNEPLYKEECMLGMMASVINGGAAALRVAGTRDVKNAKKYFNVPVIGLTKPDKLPQNWKEIVYITPSLKEVNELIDAGADIIAFDGTLRPRQNSIEEMINFIHNANRLAMADISTLEEGINCANLGADIISTTLAGYTIESGEAGEEPDWKLLKNLVKEINLPVFLEGRVWKTEDVKKAFEYQCAEVGR